MGKVYVLDHEYSERNEYNKRSEVVMGCAVQYSSLRKQQYIDHLLLLQDQANHLLAFAGEPAALVGDPNAPAEEPEVLRRGAEQVREAMPCDPPTLHGVADVLPDLGEHVDDEVAVRARELLLQHDVVDVLAERILLVRGHRVEHGAALGVPAAPAVAPLLRSRGLLCLLWRFSGWLGRERLWCLLCWRRLFPDRRRSDGEALREGRRLLLEGERHRSELVLVLHREHGIRGVVRDVVRNEHRPGHEDHHWNVLPGLVRPSAPHSWSAGRLSRAVFTMSVELLGEVFFAPLGVVMAGVAPHGLRGRLAGGGHVVVAQERDGEGGLLFADVREVLDPQRLAAVPVRRRLGS